jgi:hypothetical protein
MELTTTRTLFEFDGTPSQPVTDISITNVAFEKSYATHMDSMEVPSGGDWSIHRGGALFLQGVERIVISRCSFSYLGGNGIFVSGYSRSTEFSYNAFFALGGTAMAFVGNPRFDTTTPYDMRAETRFPQAALVSYTWVRNVGLVIKQSAPVFISIANRVSVSNCVFHEGPRSGVNINDGFLGGHVVADSVMFNLVLETLDHGPFNSWDRQKWLLPRVQETNLLSRNLLIGTPGGTLGIDLDDGSTRYAGDKNLIVYGALKLKGSLVAFTNNMVLYPQLEGAWPLSGLAGGDSAGAARTDLRRWQAAVQTHACLWLLRTCLFFRFLFMGVGRGRQN